MEGCELYRTEDMIMNNLRKIIPGTLGILGGLILCFIAIVANNYDDLRQAGPLLVALIAGFLMVLAGVVNLVRYRPGTTRGEKSRAGGTAS